MFCSLKLAQAHCVVSDVFVVKALDEESEMESERLNFSFAVHNIFDGFVFLGVFFGYCWEVDQKYQLQHVLYMFTIIGISILE